MQTTSALYNELYALNTSVIETKVEIDGVVYGEDKIKEIKTERSLFPEQTLSFGGCVSSEIDITIKPQGSIGRMALIEPYVRIVNENRHSEWLPKGKYYIDTRENNDAAGTLTLHGYDAMLKFEQNRVFLEFPMSMEDMAIAIADDIGIEIDPRSRFENYRIPSMPRGTMREILCKIAAAHGGNFVITESGKLRLIRASDTRESTDIDYAVTSFTDDDVFQPITDVTIVSDNEAEKSATSEENNGRSIRMNVIYATQAMADNLLSELNSYRYKPYNAEGAVINPAAEVGDTAIICDQTVEIITQSSTFGVRYRSDLSAPTENQLEHEYPYTSQEIKDKEEIKQAVKDSHTMLNNFNGSDIVASGATQKMVSSLNVLFGEDSTAYVELTAEPLVHTDGVLVYHLKLDQSDIKTYRVNVEQGNALHSFTYPLTGLNLGAYNVSIWVSAENGASVTIEENDAHMVIVGFDLGKVFDWNGRIYLSDTIPAVQVETHDTTVTVPAISDNVQASVRTVQGGQYTDTVPAVQINLQPPTVGIANTQDEITIETN